MATMTTKTFPIEDVLTVVTGIMLKTGADFQGVMDVLYPGIMTIGCAAMQETASEEILRQHPKIREVLRTAPDPRQYEDFLQYMRIHFGPTLEIEGPHEVSGDQIDANFQKLREPPAPK